MEENGDGGENGKGSGGKGGGNTWRDLDLDERKEKLDEFFQVILCGVVVEVSLKKKIYDLVEKGKMITAKDVKYDRINQRIISLPLMMKFSEEKGCFIEPKVDKALASKKAAIKRAKMFFT